jgi:site-specific DNA recombinase
VERDEKDWMEVDGATPAIVPQETFQRAQSRLKDPSRRKRTRPSVAYPLKGRLRCRACGAAMVGQSLLKGRYRYYRCRRSYAGPHDDRCSSRYVPQEVLESAVREALADLLADPARVLEEARRIADDPPRDGRRVALDTEIAEVESRQRRLIKLFTTGRLPESLLAEESRQLSEQRSRLEAERVLLPRQDRPTWDLEWLEGRMPEALAAIRRQVKQAKGEDFDLLLRAVDAQITASREEIEIRGEVPLVEPSTQEGLVTTGRTSA